MTEAFVGEASPCALQGAPSLRHSMRPSNRRRPPACPVSRSRHCRCPPSRPRPLLMAGTTATAGRPKRTPQSWRPGSACRVALHPLRCACLNYSLLGATATAASAHCRAKSMACVACAATSSSEDARAHAASQHRVKGTQSSISICCLHSQAAKLVAPSTQAVAAHASAAQPSISAATSAASASAASASDGWNTAEEDGAWQDMEEPAPPPPPKPRPRPVRREGAQPSVPKGNKPGAMKLGAQKLAAPKLDLEL